MHTPRHDPEPTPSPVPPSIPAMEAKGPLPGYVDVARTLLATGASFVEAVNAVKGLGGVGAVAQAWPDMLGMTLPLWHEVFFSIQDVARTDKGIANECLGLALLRLQEGPPANIYLDQQDWVTSLPDAMTCVGHLMLKGCVNLKRLPDGLTVKGHLDLASSGIEALPAGLHVQGDLLIAHCAGVQNLPDDLVVDGAFDAQGCHALESMPEGFYVRGYCDLSGCVSLPNLPPDFHVGSDLHLRGCSGFRHFSAGLSAGSIDLHGCTAWDGVIPPDAQISGFIGRDGD